VDCDTVDVSIVDLGASGTFFFFSDSDSVSELLSVEDSLSLLLVSLELLVSEDSTFFSASVLLSFSMSTDG